MGVILTLTKEEIAYAEKIGKERDCSSNKDGKKNSHGLICNPEKSLNIHIGGALGELVVRKFLKYPMVLPVIHIKMNQIF